MYVEVLPQIWISRTEKPEYTVYSFYVSLANSIHEYLNKRNLEFLKGLYSFPLQTSMT